MRGVVERLANDNAMLRPRGAEIRDGNGVVAKKWTSKG